MSDVKQLLPCPEAHELAADIEELFYNCECRNPCNQCVAKAGVMIQKFAENTRDNSERDELKAKLEEFKAAEKELSDAYLRIRELVGAWDTNHGGANRFEVTENKIKALQSQLDSSEWVRAVDRAALERADAAMVDFRTHWRPTVPTCHVDAVKAAMAKDHEVISQALSPDSGKRFVEVEKAARVCAYAASNYFDRLYLDLVERGDSFTSATARAAELEELFAKQLSTLTSHQPEQKSQEEGKR